ncbi:hypothetical protein C8R46DRAFT_1055588 [Mycena filopes]|nr:hypothetical protein C8R46DRAFT_1055588 [Mycena filopes]
MKRGFLNTSRAKARLPPPADSVAKASFLDSADAMTQASPPKHFPTGKIGKVDVSLPEGYQAPATRFMELDPNGGSLGGAMTYARVPNGPNCDYSEPASECFFFPGSKEVLLNLPNYPQPLIRPQTAAFRVLDVPGKGKGLFSTRPLKMGDLILAERPLLVCARGIPVPRPPKFTDKQFFQYALNELEKSCEIALGRMVPEAREAFMALANCHTEDGSGPIVGRVRTNGLSLSGLRPGVKGEIGLYSAVAKAISRLNHSCSPNTAPRFDMASFSYRLYAVRDVAANEELTFQYTDVDGPAAERQEALAAYDFVCSCTACKDATASDPRRAAIVAFDDKSNLLSAGIEGPGKFVAKCRAQLALIEREGLEHLPMYWSLMKTLMDVHIWRGEAKEASEWAAKLDKIHWDAGLEGDYKQFLDPESPAYTNHEMWRTLCDQ